MATASEVAGFWRDAGPKAWFVKDETFDGRCRAFEAAHHAAARGAFCAWEANAEGALALLILLDQIPRNIFRKSPHAFATDGLALTIAARAIERGFDEVTDSVLRFFFYLPFEHAEDLAAQKTCVTLFTNLGDAEYLKFAILHHDIIARFGRFPHRNAALGRTSTAEELAFLSEGGFAG
jgi:uncharacterized protein (DUF924 family)